MINDLTNTPIEFTIADQKLKVNRLSIGEFFGIAESKVKEQYIRNIQEIANYLTGKDKLDYLSQATREIPKGADLHQAAMDYLNSPSGMAVLLTIGLRKHQDITDNEITNIIMNAKEGEVQQLIQYMIGIDTPKEQTEDFTEKKTV